MKITKRAILFAIIFGVIAGLVNFVLETLCKVDSSTVFTVITAVFVVVGLELGIWRDKK